MQTEAIVREIIEENRRRNARMFAKFDPITGEGSIGERKAVRVPAKLLCGGAAEGVKTVRLWLPVEMLADKEVKALMRKAEHTEADAKAFERKRIAYDFAYWAARYVYVKRKGGGDDCLLRLNYPQRKFVEALEKVRKAGKPIRIVLLKARQWGGSTASQLYMAWLQLVHCQGLNSLIIAHQGVGSDEIKDMFDRMIRQYPPWLLHGDGEKYDENEAKLCRVGHAGLIFRVPQRNCKIKIGTAERPDSCRGGDYNLVHLSEVGLWRRTQGKKPEDIIRAACGGVLYKPNTMLVYESTANGVGNFFHREYMDARDNPHSQFRSVFISWYEIEQNRLEFAAGEEEALAQTLYRNRRSLSDPSNREESGFYLWKLWNLGATLEGINWYIAERGKHSSHGSMAAECPSDDIEAFVNSGASVFDKYLVEKFRADCRIPIKKGDMEGNFRTGKEALENVRFIEESEGLMWIWSEPDKINLYERRYLCVVDIGGRSDKADWSVIVVFDRAPMINNGPIEVVAQWRGHTDIDLLAWKSAQIALYYNNALLVIESNTIETHDSCRYVEGDQSVTILNYISDEYPNLYERQQSADNIKAHEAVKYGFHTNTRTKPMIISELIRAVREKSYVERDGRCLDELITYERKQNGAYGAIIGAHDDLLMTRAIGLYISGNVNEMPLPRKIDPLTLRDWNITLAF